MYQEAIAVYQGMKSDAASNDRMILRSELRALHTEGVAIVDGARHDLTQPSLLGGVATGGFNDIERWRSETFKLLTATGRDASLFAKANVKANYSGDNYFHIATTSVVNARISTWNNG